jgi:GDPmannose 4,6-dehydratase
MFGNADRTPQDENTPFHPRSPYGISKVTGYYLTRYYRETHGLFACNGILYNHESERRGLEFVTRKITSAVANIKAGLQQELRLGNLNVRRDWGYSPEYVEAMWMMLQHDEPDDYIAATGEVHSVQEFVEEAFAVVNLDWHEHVVIDPAFYRPTEVNYLCGDATKARLKLGWKSRCNFKDLVRIMVTADLERVYSDHRNMFDNHGQRAKK